VLQHIQSLAQSGIGVLLSTHDPDHAFICAHRVAMLHEGRLARLGAPMATITPESLKEIYGVEVAVVRVAVGEGVERPVCIPGGALSGGQH
jgi:iron complex transport system ATP-binding protein